QTLIGANVTGGFFTADVLFAWAQCHDIGAAAFFIDGFADNASSNLADIFAADCEEAEIRPAKTHGNTQWLTFPDHNICTERAGRLEQTQGSWVDDHDQQRSGL